MWRDRILEAKKEKGISFKAMADSAKLSEKTVKRMLNGEIQSYVCNVLALGASVGLSSWEIFWETGCFVGGQNLADALLEIDRLKAELDEASTKNTALADEVARLTEESTILAKEVEHKNELIRHKDEIIDLLRGKTK